MAAIAKWRRKSKPVSQNGESPSVFPQGLDEFHNPSHACVDIVFIHGLTGDRERTWTHSDSLQPWPREILPALIPDARILTYGYDAYVLGHCGPATRNCLGDHSRDFLNELVSYRRRSKSLARPLIFIVHSLGGLLCKDSLLLSRNSADGHLNDVGSSTIAIAFMGTPHSGSALARWAKIPVVSLGVMKSSSTCPLSVLQTNNDVLHRIQNDFLEMIRARSRTDRNIEITCFYEALPMPMFGIIVPQKSAVLAGFNSISIRGNHRNMVRFSSSTDPGLRSLLGELSRWIDAVMKPSAIPALPSQLEDTGYGARGPSKSLLPIDKPESWTNHEKMSSPMANSQMLAMDNRLTPTTLPHLSVKPNAGAAALFRRQSEHIPLHQIRGISQRQSPSTAGSLKGMNDPGSSGMLIDSVKVHAPVKGARGALGLNLLVNPNVVMMDLIFVHGLGGGSCKSWTFSDPSIDCWPQTFLPFEAEFENCRIHSFGYDCEFASESGPNIFGIADFGKALLNSLIYSPVLRKTPETPIVFVCHSMGGLVAKKAYILASQDLMYQTTAARFRAMVFLSTPHRGSDVAATLNNILKATSITRPKPFIADLAPNSESIESINECFRHLAAGLSLFSFYETVPVKIRPTQTIVVARHSAVLGYPTEGNGPLMADHRSMCKFSTPQDPNYVAVRNVLALIVAGEIRAIDETRTRSHQDAYNQVNKLLGNAGELRNFEDFTEDKDTASSRWITSHPAFQRWCDASCDRASQILLLRALPGAGKTVLARRVARHLEINNSDSAHFFFANSHDIKSRACVCLNSIALQLARANEEICYGFRNLLEEYPTFDRDDVKEVWGRLFRGVIFKIEMSRPFYLILDAIDECREGSLLLALLLSHEVTPMLRVFMTCRTTPPPDIEAALERAQYPLTSLEISPVAIASDAEALVSENIAKLKWMENDVSDGIAREALQRFSGCFLWIKLVFEGLQQVYTASAIREVLEGVPLEMAESYKKALQSASRRCKERRLL